MDDKTHLGFTTLASWSTAIGMPSRLMKSTISSILVQSLLKFNYRILVCLGYLEMVLGVRECVQVVVVDVSEVVL